MLLGLQVFLKVSKIWCHCYIFWHGFGWTNLTPWYQKNRVSESGDVLEMSKCILIMPSDSFQMSNEIRALNWCYTEIQDVKMCLWCIVWRCQMLLFSLLQDVKIWCKWCQNNIQFFPKKWHKTVIVSKMLIQQIVLIYIQSITSKKKSDFIRKKSLLYIFTRWNPEKIVNLNSSFNIDSRK